MLHVGLVLRVAVGDGLGVPLAWDAGIWLTVAALLLLPLISAALVVTGRRPSRTIAAGRAAAERTPS